MSTTIPFAKKTTLPSEVTKILPWNKEAERSVLGAILLDDSVPNKTLKAVAEVIHGGDFGLSENARIFARMLDLDTKQSVIDLLTLTESLETTSTLDLAGGSGYISSLVDGVPKICNVKHYAKIVLEKSRLRQIIRQSYAVQVRASERDADPDLLSAELAALSKQTARVNALGLVATDAIEFCSMPLDPLEYVLEPLLTVRGRGMVFSPRGAGKTYITMDIAYCVAAGIENCFMWHVPKCRPVLYVDGEMHAAMLQQRQQAIVLMHPERRPVNGFLRLVTRDLQKDSRPKINTADGRARIEQLLNPGELLILDNISSLSPSADEKETEDWAQIEDWFSDLCWHGVSVLFVHHAGKGGDQRGTSKREDLLDFVLNLRVPSDHTMEEGLRAEAHLTKLRGRSPNPVYGRPFEISLGNNHLDQPVWLLKPLRDLLRRRALQMLADGMKTNDVVLETGLTRWTVARLQRKLKEPGFSIERDPVE